MIGADSFHFATVGASLRLVRNLWARIGSRGGFKASHIVHPTYDRASWRRQKGPDGCYFFRDDLRLDMPPADREFLASLEDADQVPTIHNMILGDRVVSKLPYPDAL